MPRKRTSYIDKKKSVSYALLASDGPGNDGTQQVFHPIKKGGRWIEDEFEEDVVNHFGTDLNRQDDEEDDDWDDEYDYDNGPGWEKKRREILALGLPDDGYDYTQHLRTITARDEEEDEDEQEDDDRLVIGERPKRDNKAHVTQDGASVFVKAPEVSRRVEDRALYRANALRVEAARDEEEAETRDRTVSAMVRPVEDFRGAAEREMRELEAAVAELDGVDSDGDSGFFDDFVLKASEDVPVEEAGPSRTVAVGGGGGEAEGEDGGEGASDVSSEPDVGGAVGPSGKRLPFDAQSIASSAWMKPARTDRNDALDVIDERFEAMVMKEYAEEEFGDLDSDEEGGADEARGPLAVEELGGLLDDFLAEHQGAKAREKKKQYISAAEWFAQQEALQRAAKEDGKADDDGSEMEEITGERSVARAEEITGDEDFDGIEGGEDEQGQFGGAERLVRLHRRRAEEEEQEEATIAHERTKELVKRFVDEGAMEGSGDGDGTLAKEMRSGYLKRREVSKWDAETVLSLRSNLDNHPGTLDAPRRGKIRLSSKTGLPVGYVGAEGRERKLEEVAEGEEEGEEEEERVMVEARKKGETKEERKARKQAVKEAQREARQRKKGLKTAFTEAKKEESKRQAVGGHGVSAMRL